MDILTTGFVALLLFAAFAYHSVGLFVVLWGPHPLPAPVRRALLPRQPARSALRVLSGAWVLAISILTQVIALAAALNIGLASGPGYVMLAEIGLAAAWVGFLWRHWRVPPRNR